MNGTEVRELWQLCGFHLETDNRRGYHWEQGQRYHDWLTPDGQTSGGNHGINKGKLPSLDDIEALGYLFKWAVPLLIKKHPNYSIHLERFAREDKFIARIGMDIVKADYDPAEALAQACLKALREAK